MKKLKSFRKRYPNLVMGSVVVTTLFICVGVAFGWLEPAMVGQLYDTILLLQ